jgi:CDP-diacylglycerol--glycerol-3-phosphate 3-phosphatidyltransferase
MPSIYQLKTKFQALLRPIVQFLARRGVTANQVTVAACLLSLAGGAVVYQMGLSRWLLVVPAILFIRMALNAIDGMLAREHGQKSPLGGFLNELGDVFSDAFLYLPFGVLPGFSPPLTACLVILAIISEMAGVLGVSVGASRRYDGPMGKSDRAFIFGAMALALSLGLAPGAWCNIVLGVVNLLLLMTIANRVRMALKEL